MKSPAVVPVVEEQIVAFADLSGFHRLICSKLGPEETFGFLSEYYAVAQRALEGSEGRVVKFIGDAILLVFPAAEPSRAVADLKKLKAMVEFFLAQSHPDARFLIKAHVGIVAAGVIGSNVLARFDVCGLAVNQAALLPDGEWILSEELQRRIKP